MNTSLQNLMDISNAEVLTLLASVEVNNDDDAIQIEDFMLQIREQIRDGRAYLKVIYSYFKVLLSQYEATIPKPVVDPIDSLRFLMEEHGDKQSDLSDVAPRSVISEILSGKRKLNKGHIERLSERYHVSPALFF